MPKNQKIEIEIQHFHGCPNGPELINRIEKAITGLEDQIHYKETLVETNELAGKIKFLGSPTLLINGRDFNNQPVPSSPHLSCRYYANGLPSVEAIHKKIIVLLK
jgi:hypothetical protein